MRNVWQVYGDYSADGWGERTYIGTFARREDAERAAKGQSGWGHSDGYVSSYTVYDDWNDWEMNGPGRPGIRRQALAKLTSEEKEALGLKDDN